MTASKTKIISYALTILGHKPIQDLNNPDSITLAAEQAYDVLMPESLETGSWRFAVQISQLSKLNETPPNRWNYVYSLPAGYLKMIRIYPQNYDYEVYENRRIYSNWGGETPMYMEYVFKPDESLFPFYFQNLIGHMVADHLALSSAQSPDYVSVIRKKLLVVESKAKAADSQNRPNFSQVDFPVLNRRGISDSTYSGN